MLTLGDRALNDALGGGIPINGITEIVGEAGLGKTQLGMQLCLNVQLPGSVGGMGKGALYLYTKGPFPAKRLKEMSEIFIMKHMLQYHPMDKIKIAMPHDWKQLLCLLTKPANEPGISALPNEMMTGDFGLIVLDSIGGLFRAFGVPRPNYTKRRLVLNEVANRLLSYSGVAIVVINEVSTAIQDNGINVPTLTTQWQNHVARSIWITRNEKDGTRRFQFNNLSVPISICDEGVRAEDPPDSDDEVLRNVQI